MATPFMKFVGGKSKLLHALIPRAPNSFATYREVFVGGGALFFALEDAGLIKRAVLSDADSSLIATWRAVRDCPRKLLRKLAAMHNTHDFFMSVRRRPLGVLRSDTAAWRIYLAKTAFNGIWRVNRAGDFNVPFGKYKNPLIVDRKTIMAASDALNGRNDAPSRAVCIQNRDFELAIDAARSDDLVYADPPYDPLSKTSDFSGYTPGRFSSTSQRLLRDALLRAKARGVYIIASNADTPDMRVLYDRPEFKLDSVVVRRNIAADGDKRVDVRELIIT